MRIHTDFLRVRINTYDAGSETFLEFVRQVGWNWFFNHDVRKKTVRRRSWSEAVNLGVCERVMVQHTDWTKFCMVLAYTLDSMELHLDRLTWSQFH